MAMITFRLSTVAQRLAPLYVMGFFVSFIFFYAVEKLFMKEIGFNDATIGLMVAVYSSVMLLAEVPSGILADRWSRRGVLMIGCASLAIGALICGLSNGVWLFIIGTVFWGIFDAMVSGTDESIIYDTLVEENQTDRYEYFLGRYQIVSSIGLVCSSLLGGLIGQSVNTRATYLLSVPLALCGIAAIWWLKEPTVHKKEASEAIVGHINSTFRALLGNRSIMPVVVVLVLVSVVSTIYLELDQLWLIALAVPVGLFGAVNAGIVASFGLSGVLAGLRYKKAVTSLVLAAIVTAVLTLTLSRSSLTVIIMLILITTATLTLRVIFSKTLHDNLPSRVRAGAASGISSLSRIIVIPVVLFFTNISQSQGVFSANYITVTLVGMLLVAFAVSRIIRPSQKT